MLVEILINSNTTTLIFLVFWCSRL